MATVYGLSTETLISTGLRALDQAKCELSKAHIPAALAGAADKSKELTANRLTQAASHALMANPGAAVALGVTSVGLFFVAAPAAITAPALAAAGFGTNGIVAGSAAAGIHSGIGSAVAPSLFATLQSAGAGGYGVAMVHAAVQVAGGAIATSAAGTMAWFKGRNVSANEEDLKQHHQTITEEVVDNRPVTE